MDYSTSTQITAWYLPVGTTFIGAISVWSTPLRHACFASLRARGNYYRQQLFSSLAQTWCTNDSALRDFAALKRASYMEPYWFSMFVNASRRLARCRTAQRWGNEADLRRAPCTVLLLSADQQSRRRTRLERIHYWERACYLCDADQWMPESMSHLLLHCRHPAVRDLRSSITNHLRALSLQITRTIPSAPTSPDFSDEMALYCVLQLCTGVGLTHHREQGGGVYELNVLRPMGILTRSRQLELDRMALEQRRRQWFQLDPDRMRGAVAWTSFLCNSWRESVGDDQATSDAAAAGQQLVDLICLFNQNLFSARRRSLCDDVHYLTRDRDPAPISF
jgi:hypothetical protein